MREPYFSDLKRRGESYADGLHPNPRAYKHRWWVFHAESPIEGKAFLSKEFAITTAAMIKLRADLAAKKHGYFLYGYGVPRRAEGSPFDPDSPAMKDVEWAPGYDDDTDEGVEIDGVIHK